MINVLVIDSHNTAEVARNIRNHFGGKVTCYEENCPENMKIDLFILSGLFILTGGLNFVSDLKSRVGSSKSKVVAVSVRDDFLEEIEQNPALGVDFTISKDRLLKELTLADEKIGNNEVGILLDKILASVS